LISISLIFSFAISYCQGDNEIQVYASPTIANRSTIFELHSNYTFKGINGLAEPKSARYLNETLEITRGFGNNFEIGVYFFSTLFPGGKYQYLGSQIRPRVTVPKEWHWPFGASLSTEFGFFRPTASEKYFWQGEIRPIIDQNYGNLYMSLNPNIDFVLTGDDKHWGFSPQFKTVYTVRQKIGFGFEYYSSLGTFDEFLPFRQQEHLIGPMVDLYFDPRWEFNAGMLFGLTEGSNQQILKILIGRRIAPKSAK